MNRKALLTFIACIGIFPAFAQAPQGWGTTPDKNPGERTTVGGARWFDYANDILALATSASCNPVSGISDGRLDIWFDTTAVYGTTTGTTVYSQKDFTSFGLLLDPMDTIWSAPSTFTGVISVTPTNAYLIDSIRIPAWYNRSYATFAKRSVVDTLIVTFISGTDTANFSTDSFSGAGILSGYCSPPSLHYLEMYYDSLHNRAGNRAGSVISPATTYTYKILLTSADTNNSDQRFLTQYPRTVAAGLSSAHTPDPTISVPYAANHYASVSVSFRSGDASYPSTPMSGPGSIAFPGSYDTVRLSTGIGGTISNKYNTYEADIVYSSSTTSPFVRLPPYPWPADHTSGYFKKQNMAGWGGKYVPNWYWTTPTAYNYLQYPGIAFHVVCPTCLVPHPPTWTTGAPETNAPRVLPNPADNSVTIACGAGGDATVTITNMVGETMTTQTATGGKITINTSSYTTGLYLYAVVQNGSRWVGRLQVVH